MEKLKFESNFEKLRETLEKLEADYAYLHEQLRRAEAENAHLHEQLRRAEAENAYLRDQLGKPKVPPLTLEEAIMPCYILDENGKRTKRTNEQLSKAYRCLLRFSHYEESLPLYSLDGITVNELLEMRNTGIVTVATIIVILEHYNIRIKRSTLSKVNYDQLEATIRDLKSRMRFDA